MFDWFWDFLYSISEILFELIDALLVIGNRLCGVEPVTIDGKEANFMLELLKNEKVFAGFGGAALIGIFLLMIFGVVAICKNCKDGKKSNAQIAVQVFKTLGLFFLVPTLMVGFTVLLNQLVVLLYKATASGTPSLGAFLFENFLPPGMTGYEGSYDYTSVKSVRNFMAGAGYDLSDFRFFFSWIISIPILIFVARALLLFVERCISIVLLFIMSPISLSTTVLDDGQKFKVWRDKILTKYLSGYGMIIGLNIYILVLSFMTRANVEFGTDFPFISDKLVSFILRICFAIGGAFFLPNIFAMFGDLFVQGAGGEFKTADGASSGMFKTMGAIKKAIFDKDEKKEKEEEDAEKDQSRLRKLASGGGSRGGRGGYGGGSGGGGGQGNKSGVLSQIYDTGKKILKAIAGPATKNNENNENNEGSGGKNNNSSSKEFNKTMQKKSGFEKVAETTANIIKTGVRAGEALATQGKSEMNKGQGGK